MSDPRVSVIIVSWNSAAYIGRCLEALAEQTYRDLEVIVADNCSTDHTLAVVEATRTPWALRIERFQSNIGYAAATNAAARLAEGYWLALLNPDAFPEPDWLEQLIQAAAQFPNSFFACRQIQADRPRLLDGEGDLYHVSGLAQRRGYNLPAFPPGQPREVFSACGAAALLPRQEFLAAGGFDEDYFAYQEDVDLGFRLRLRGLRCICVPSALVRHVGMGSTGARSDFSTYHGHRNLEWTYFKDMPAPWVWIFLPLHLIMNFSLILYFMLTGRGRVIWHAKLDAWKGLRSALRKRGAVQAQRNVPVSQVIGAMDSNPLAPLAGWIARHHPREA